MPLGQGTRVGPYEVVAPLGAGGMGEVYRARDSRLGREVAIKVLPASVASDPDRLRRFELEAKATSALNHPNILAVFDVGAHDGSPYVVSELLEGETLRARLGGPLPARKALDYATQLARGLAAAHEKGIVHRDLKPANVFVTRDGRLKILDFGIAKLTGREAASEDLGEIDTATRETEDGTKPGTVLGTAGYMSPEQVQGLPVTHRSDVFAFGSILYEMLSGRRAFRGATKVETMAAILRQEPPELSGLGGPALPPGLERILRHCLEKNPDERFQSAHDLAFALDALSTASATSGTSPFVRSASNRRQAIAVLAGLVLLAAGILIGTYFHRSSPADFTRLTFQQGQVWTARFAPDGQTIVYTGVWQGRPAELFSTRAGARESRSLGIADAHLLSISASSEMALLLNPRMYAWGVFTGTLARAALSGGTPRELLEDVIDADWAPDGDRLAAITLREDGCRLEFPLGTALYRPPGPTWLSHVKIAPDGQRVACLEHPVPGDDRGDVVVVDRHGRKTTLASGFSTLTGLAWDPHGREVWFSGGRTGAISAQIWAVTSTGQARMALTAPGIVSILDVGQDRRVLMRRVTTWTEIHAQAAGESSERDLSERDITFVEDLSNDGRILLGTDLGFGGGPHFSFYVRKTDGSPAKWLGEGEGQALSPDGRWALKRVFHTAPQKLVLVPTGAGEERILAAGAIERYSRAGFFPDGSRIVFAGTEQGRESRLYVQELAGAAPRPISGEGVDLGRVGHAVAPDGRLVVAHDSELAWALYPVDAGQPTTLPALNASDVPIQWTADGRGLYFVRYGDSNADVHRLELTTGHERLFKRIVTSAPSGLLGQSRIFTTPDGQSHVYNYTRVMIDLYLAEGVD